MRPVPRHPCLAMVWEFEGDHGVFEATRTLDPTGHYEIGWGHKLLGPADPLWDATITQDEADALALEDLGKAAAGVCAILGDGPFGYGQLSEGQYAAVLDFAYNEGVGRFAGSTLCHLIGRGALGLAALEFPKWVYGRVDGIEQVLDGLVKRRQRERMFWEAKPL